jgi:signal transduction histidine kinase
MTHASDITKLIINSSRRIASSLRPSMIDELSLPTSLEWQCRRFSSMQGIPCQFMHEQVGDDTELPVEIKTALFRICQDALMNIAQHANATAVTVLSRQVSKMMTVVISDNGIGFINGQNEKQYGLIGMRERAHSFNGELTIHSELGKGTKISVTIPVP